MRKWNVPHIAQNNSYYCGPAAAQAIITYWAVVNRTNRNSVYGDPLSQVFLAVQCNQAQAGCDDVYGKFLQTEEYKETLWNYFSFDWVGNTFKRRYHYPMQRGINRWRQNNEYGGDYLPVGPPGSVLDKNKMHDHWITDIDAAFPLVFDVHENTPKSGGGVTPALPGHPTDRPISHWFAVRGYSVAGYYDNKDWVHYVDSAYGGQGFTVYPNQPWRNYTLTQGNQRVSFDNVYEMMKVRGYGYVW